MISTFGAMEVIIYEYFDECEDILRDLENRAQNNNPFLSVDWLKLWWEHFGRDKSLYIMIIVDNGDPIGFAPFYLIRNSRIKSFHLIGSGFSSYLDMNCVTGYEHKMLESIFLHFKSSGTAVLINFHDINDRFSKFFPAIIDNLKMSGSHVSSFQLYPCPLAALGDNWNNFLKKVRSKKSRSNLKRSDRLLSKLGNLKFREITNTDELNNIVPDLKLIHNDRFKETVNPLFKCEKGLFLIDVLKQMLFSRISLSVLELDSEPISFIIGFKMGDVFIDFAPAFDPAFKFYSLGHIHLMRLMENKCDEGFRYFDFSKGEGDYKRQWSNDETNSYLFRFGLNLNRLDNWYLKAMDYLFKLFIFLRERGINNKIKHLIVKLSKWTLFNKEKKIKLIRRPLKPEFLTQDLPRFSYQVIRDLPIEVRKAIFGIGMKENITLMRIILQPELRRLNLFDTEKEEEYLIRY